MPELPEVETNARNLAAWTLGRRIVSVAPPTSARQRDGAGRTAFRERLEGRRVQRVARRGKWTLVDLEGDAALGLHLGMTGKLARAADGDELPRFSRAVLALDDRTRVCFVDARRFGKLVAAPTIEALWSRPEIASIGPDALEEVTPAQLAAGLSRTSRTIKETLLDQRVVAGIGNLYATEALWRARIHPATPARRVATDRATVRRLLAAVRAALRHGFAELGDSELPQYLEDGAPNHFHAYDRAGAPCHRCRTPIRAIALGGRTNAYCPRCQKR